MFPKWEGIGECSVWPPDFLFVKKLNSRESSSWYDFARLFTLDDTMAFATNFDRYLMKFLKQADGLSNYTWESGWAPKGEPWKVDVAGEPDDPMRPIVLIETELKKDNPVENVVKVWRWAKQEKCSRPILFLHVFTGHYVKTRTYAAPPAKVKQYVRAVFIGEQMKKDQSLRIDYQPIAMKFRPRMVKGKTTKEGGGAMHKAAKNLGQEIATLLRKELVLTASA